MVIALLATALWGSSAHAEKNSALVSLAGRTHLPEVDSEDARLYLGWLTRRSLLGERDRRESLPPRLARLDQVAASSSLGREQLQALTERHSVDLATLLFARSILADPANADLQAFFTTALERVEPAAGALDTAVGLPKVLFVPGFLYRSHPETGADFATPRRHLRSLGVPTELVETDESGSIEGNAARIAAAVRRQRGGAIIVVSASKAGPEVALALGALLEPTEVQSVAAWINIGGLLGGSPLADQALRPPQRWLLRMAVWWNDLDLAGVRGLRTSESRRRLSALRIPPALAVVNVVAAPLGGDLSKRAEDGYGKLRRLGPNDGLALLADQILPGSKTLLLLGDDHFLTHWDPRTLTLALLATARYVMTPESVSVVADEQAPASAPSPMGLDGRKRNQIPLEQTFRHQPFRR